MLRYKAIDWTASDGHLQGSRMHWLMGPRRRPVWKHSLRYSRELAHSPLPDDNIPRGPTITRTTPGLHLSSFAQIVSLVLVALSPHASLLQRVVPRLRS